MASCTCAIHIQITWANHFVYMCIHIRYMLAHLWAYSNSYSILNQFGVRSSLLFNNCESCTFEDWSSNAKVARIKVHFLILFLAFSNMRGPFNELWFVTHLFLFYLNIHVFDLNQKNHQYRGGKHHNLVMKMWVQYIVDHMGNMLMQ